MELKPRFLCSLHYCHCKLYPCASNQTMDQSASFFCHLLLPSHLLQIRTISACREMFQEFGLASSVCICVSRTYRLKQNTHTHSSKLIKDQLNVGMCFSHVIKIHMKRLRDYYLTCASRADRFCFITSSFLILYSVPWTAIKIKTFFIHLLDLNQPNSSKPRFITEHKNTTLIMSCRSRGNRDKQRRNSDSLNYYLSQLVIILQKGLMLEHDPGIDQVSNLLHRIWSVNCKHKRGRER